jgi:ankyrin repeat protein
MSKQANQVKISPLLKNALGQDDLSMRGLSSQQATNKPIDLDDTVNFDDFMDEDDEYDEDDEDNEAHVQAAMSAAGGDNMEVLAGHIEQLFRFAIDGEEDKLMELLEKTQLHPDAEDGAGHTPFLVAARHGRLGVMKRLLADGCNPAHRTRNGNSAWMLAAAAGNLEALGFLMEEVGPRLPGREFESVLVNRNKDTVLMFAAMAGRFDAVEYLVRLGGIAGVLQSLPQASGRMHPLSLFFLNSDGLTVVMCACESGDIPTIEILLTAVQDAFGELPPSSVQKLHDESALVMERLSALDDRVRESLTALGGHNMAKKPQKKQHIEPEDTETAAYLNHCDANGNTALHVASKLLHTAPVVEILLNLGADPSLRNINGMSAEDVWGDRGGVVAEMIEERKNRKQRNADLAMMELLGDDKKKKKKGKGNQKFGVKLPVTKPDNKKRVNDELTNPSVSISPIVSSAPAPAPETAAAPAAMSLDAEKAEKAVVDAPEAAKTEEQPESQTEVETVPEVEVDVTATAAVDSSADDTTAAQTIATPTANTNTNTTPVPAPTAPQADADADADEWHTVAPKKHLDGKKAGDKAKDKAVGDKTKEKKDVKKADNKADAKVAGKKGKDGKEHAKDAKSASNANTWAAMLAKRADASHGNANTKQQLPYPSSRTAAPDSVQLPPASSPVSAAAISELTLPAALPMPAPHKGPITVTASTLPPVPPLTSSSVPGALTRQLYRLDDRAESLSVTPMHLMGHGISSLSNEQVSCVEGVLEVLLQNIRRVKEVRAERVANELAQQLADAQAMIALLNHRLEQSDKDKTTDKSQ